MARVSFLPEASRDYDEAFAWYHQRSERAATRFEEAVQQALDQILEAPHRWPLCDDRHRYHLLKRYPYHIVYRLQNEDIVVVAVAHGRRRPRYWKRR